MKSHEKKMIEVLFVILLISIIIVVVNKNKKVSKSEDTEENSTVEEFVQVLDDGTKLNTSTKLNEAKEVNGLKFENIQFTEKNGQSVLLANVTNNSGKETKFTLVDVILYDKNGNEIAKVGGIVSPLQPGAKTQFNSSMTLDYANAYDFKIIIK